LNQDPYVMRPGRSRAASTMSSSVLKRLRAPTATKKNVRSTMASGTKSLSTSYGRWWNVCGWVVHGPSPLLLQPVGDQAQRGVRTATRRKGRVDADRAALLRVRRPKQRRCARDARASRKPADDVASRMHGCLLHGRGGRNSSISGTAPQAQKD